MKTKIIYALLLSILCLSAYAELQYKSVLNNGIARWSILCEYADFFDSQDFIINEKDTLINGISYNKISVEYFNSLDESNEEWKNHTPEEYWSYNNYFIRESENADRLYIWDAEKNKEILISDMNLMKGDQFNVFLSYNGANSIDAFVDSVYIKDGLKHVQLDYDFRSFMNYDKLTFIEGVGPNTGILYYDWWGNKIVNCFQNDALFYKNDFNNNDLFKDFHCGWRMPFNGLKENDYKNYDIKMVGNELIISTEISQDVQIVINNIQGQRCFDKKVSGLQNLPLSFAGFPVGIYFLNIYNNGIKVYMNKFLYK